MYVGHAQGTLWWFVITAVVENLAPLVMPPLRQILVVRVDWTE